MADNDSPGPDNQRCCLIMSLHWASVNCISKPQGEVAVEVDTVIGTSLNLACEHCDVVLKRAASRGGQRVRGKKKTKGGKKNKEKILVGGKSCGTMRKGTRRSGGAQWISHLFVESSYVK
jgi:hypothetical protein